MFSYRWACSNLFGFCSKLLQFWYHKNMFPTVCPKFLYLLEENNSSTWRFKLRKNMRNLKTEEKWKKRRKRMMRKQGRHHGGGAKGEKAPLKISKKGEITKYEVFSCIKVVFLSFLMRKYVLWKGFYHDFSTKKASASGGFAPWPPPRSAAPWPPHWGCCPLDARGSFIPPNDLP